MKGVIAVKIIAVVLALPRRRRIAAALSGCLAVLLAATVSAQPSEQFPLIKGAGGVHALPQAAEQPRRGTKVLFDVTTGDAAEAVTRPARMLNLYALSGIRPGPDLHVAVVFHGKATALALSDAARAAHGLAADPKLAVFRALTAAGVELFVCGQSLLDQKFTAAEVAPDVKLALSALNVTINKHMDGYLVVPVP